MVALAQLVFELALPTEESGPTSFVAPEREEAWVRHLFEKAVLGFARVELEPHGWSVRGGAPLQWQVSSASDNMFAILPRMITDIVLEPPSGGRRLIVDTKFTAILEARRFGGLGLRSEYLYQMYAYLRSQDDIDEHSRNSDGLLLHPAINAELYERAVIQGHGITFATVDLAGPTEAIRRELRTILAGRSPLL